ncbi:MAG: plasmid stabilization system protein [Ignavibacteria bacterium]|nr:plasmid stabilization system protein [Ignavibacteria bacterium]
MGKIVWSPSALNDVDSIAEFIAKDSVHRASLFALHLIEAVERLKVFPNSGRIIPEINDQSCREIIYGSYRIMYQLENDDVRITGVIHSSRN